MVDVAQKDKLINTIVSNAVDLDEKLEGISAKLRVRNEQLLNNPNQRHAALWDEQLKKSGVDPNKWADLSLDQMLDVSRHLRGQKWRQAHAAIAATAQLQAELELLYIPALELAYTGGRRAAALSRKLDRITAQAAAKEGMKAKRKAERERRKNGNTQTDTDGPSATD